MNANVSLPRDVFLDVIYNEALKNKKIIFLSADFGAAALDRFRENIKDQFIHVGISEQNMIDVAAGLSQSGRIVYVYAMAPFVTLRCFEQIKVTLASMNLPVTIVGVGAGFSYDDAGPTHYATEDISCMRSLGNIEILSPSDTKSAQYAAKLSFEKPAFRYVRLDRKFMPDIYTEKNEKFLMDGLAEIKPGRDVCIISNGYMIPKILKACEKLSQKGIEPGIVDLFRIKPLNRNKLKEIIQNYSRIITIEEHFISGGMGSVISEAMTDEIILKPHLRIALNDHYYMENGGRDYLHSLAQIDPDSLCEKIERFSCL